MMFRLFSAVSKGIKALEPAIFQSSHTNGNILTQNVSNIQASLRFTQWFTHRSLLPTSELNGQICKSPTPILQPSIRTLTKFSLRKGKRKSVKAVLNRFYRLDWGIWIRTKAGRQKHLWRKTSDRKRRLRQHVFCNATQSTLLDKMVTRFWKRPHYYVDDPYEPYHKREEFPITRRKPI